MEGRGEIPHVERRTDSKGRQQPAHKGADGTDYTGTSDDGAKSALLAPVTFARLVTDSTEIAHLNESGKAVSHATNATASPMMAITSMSETATEMLNVSTPKVIEDGVTDDRRTHLDIAKAAVEAMSTDEFTQFKAWFRDYCGAAPEWMSPGEHGCVASAVNE